MRSFAATLWAHLGGDPTLLASLHESGERVFASRFDVTGFARDAVGVATLAAAELLAARGGGAVRAEVDSATAAAAFRSEALLLPVGFSLPPVWDPLAGDYRARDRWIKLHTNYAHHRAAALSALGLGAGPTRGDVEAAVSSRDAADLESAVIEAGGCAAAMYTRDEWLALPHGAAAAADPPVALGERPGGTGAPLTGVARGEAPLAGVRVLDLTRVIAGPVCTRFLAAHGAEVLRIDPPGFEEVAALVPDTTAGKRCAFLALDTEAGRSRFFELVRGADVLVCGLRPGALAGLGLADEALVGVNPSLVTASLDAYGLRGPWRGRRGFDSLVQMSSGIAAACGGERPTPLPAQALDHGTGYLLAAAVCRALAIRARGGPPCQIHASLLGAANHLFARGLDEAPAGPSLPWPEAVFEQVATAWGPLRRVRCPGRLGGVSPSWGLAPGPLGASPPLWA